jgi:hypothetical protein
MRGESRITEHYENGKASMKTSVSIVIALIILTFTLPAMGEAEAESSSATQAGTDELHFVSVLTLRGHVVATDPTNRLLTVRGANGNTSTVEAKSENDLEQFKVGDHVTIRYFEGAQIAGENERQAVPASSLKHGMVAGKLSGPSRKKRKLVATVEAVDVTDQELTVRAPDGSRETIMVANPEYLTNIKVGDRIGLLHVQALALSLEKES